MKLIRNALLAAAAAVAAMPLAATANPAYQGNWRGVADASGRVIVVNVRNVTAQRAEIDFNNGSRQFTTPGMVTGQGLVFGKSRLVLVGDNAAEMTLEQNKGTSVIRMTKTR